MLPTQLDHQMHTNHEKLFHCGKYFNSVDMSFESKVFLDYTKVLLIQNFWCVWLLFP